MQASKWQRKARPQLKDLGVASTATLGLPVADIPEPMGFWHRTGISVR